MAKPLNHQQYIGTFPEATQELLRQMQHTIITAAPGAVEVVSYSMPAYKFNGMMLAWFAGYERHIGFYPGSSAIAAFQQDIAGYKNAKGSVQFPLDKPLPVELITRMVQFKAAGNLQKAGKRKKETL
ncbi:MAG: DUF1801 domain-containing protein [Bacteroidota bacterium]